MQIRKGQLVTIEYPDGSVCEGIALHDVVNAYEARIRLRDGDEILTCKGWLADDISVEPVLCAA